MAKYYGFECRTIFSTEGSFGYRIRNAPASKQGKNTPKKYRKSISFRIFDVFLPCFEGCCVFLSFRGPSLCQGNPLKHRWIIILCQRVTEAPSNPEDVLSTNLLVGSFSSLILGTSRRANTKTSSLISDESGFPHYE